MLYEVENTLLHWRLFIPLGYAINLAVLVDLLLSSFLS
jgi:hypothetical protein